MLESIFSDILVKYSYRIWIYTQSLDPHTDAASLLSTGIKLANTRSLDLPNSPRCRLAPRIVINIGKYRVFIFHDYNILRNSDPSTGIKLANTRSSLNQANFESAKSSSLDLL